MFTSNKLQVLVKRAPSETESSQPCDLVKIPNEPRVFNKILTTYHSDGNTDGSQNSRGAQCECYTSSKKRSTNTCSHKKILSLYPPRQGRRIIISKRACLVGVFIQLDLDVIHFFLQVNDVLVQRDGDFVDLEIEAGLERAHSDSEVRESLADG
jgi:hypothetical protein